MDTFQFFDTDVSQENETQLFLNIDEIAEQTFLDQVGGSAAGKRNIAAMADQYSGTLVGTLCFAGSDMIALEIWAQRCRELDMTSLLTINAQDPDLMKKAASFCTDGIVLDCRNTVDFSVINAVSDVMADGMFYLLLSAEAGLNAFQFVNFSVVQGVIVCSDEKCFSSQLPVSQWLTAAPETKIVAGVTSALCEANGKKWFVTPEIMNGTAVSFLSKGCSGLWLDGFCADLFNPDSLLFDIYETCGQLNECVGAKRRHLLLTNELRTVLPGADYHCSVHVGPVLTGAPVCIVLAADDVADADVVCVSYEGKEIEYTGEPVVIIRNEKGRLCENQCLGTQTKCFEFYVGNQIKNEELQLCIHNNSKKILILRWIEASVNI